MSTYRAIPFKAYFCKCLRWINFPVGKLYCDLHFKGIFKFKIQDKPIKLISYNSTIENEIFWKGIENGWEKYSIKLWTDLVSDAKTVVDVGANTGIYSLIAAAKNKNSKIYCFEPSKSMFKKLEKNIEINSFDNIMPIEMAVSNKCGSALFFDVNTQHQYSASLNNEMLEDNSVKTSYMVRTITLDEYFDGEKIDLLKIDVEMHEPEVLEGMENIIKNDIPDVLIEILTNDIAEKIEKHFDPKIYDYYDIDENNGISKRKTLTKSSTYNYLICKKTTSKNLLFK